MPQYPLLALQPAAGMFATTTVGTTTFDAWVARVVEAEEMDEAQKPTTARATTKVRMAMFFIWRISPWRYIKYF
jgi:hypothetical protein